MAVKPKPVPVVEQKRANSRQVAPGVSSKPLATSYSTSELSKKSAVPIQKKRSGDTYLNNSASTPSIRPRFSEGFRGWRSSSNQATNPH